MAGTLTLTEVETGPDVAAEARVAPHLYLLLEADRPLAGSARHCLDGIDVVEIGRGSVRGAARLSHGGTRHLVVTVPDRWMSTSHARLVRGGGGWEVHDSGSKNGTLVNGAATPRAPLADGDLIELGHTFLLWRSEVPIDAGDALDLSASRVRAETPGLGTLDPLLQRRFADLVTIGPSTIPVMLLGETGTGKEVTARALHRLSARAGDFVPVNCGALPESLLLSELFGHRKGAFSGADADRTGLVRAADGGTLFLDEIGDLPSGFQTAFLRVLQEREVTPLGATRPEAVDLRLVTATLHDIDALVAAGRFRADLQARIAGYTLRLPPLRERRVDLGLLIGEILRKVGGGRADDLALTAPAARALLLHDWPRNIRELERCLDTAAVLAGHGEIEREHLSIVRPPGDGPAAAVPDAAPAVTSADERGRILEALRQAAGNQTRAAQLLGMSRRTLLRRLDELAIERPRKR